jgi:hypothetical protein
MVKVTFALEQAMNAHKVAVDGDGWSKVTLPQGKRPGILYRRLFGPQGKKRTGTVKRNIALTSDRNPDRQAYRELSYRPVVKTKLYFIHPRAYISTIIGVY